MAEKRKTRGAQTVLLDRRVILRLARNRALAETGDLRGAYAAIFGFRIAITGQVAASVASRQNTRGGPRNRLVLARSGAAHADSTANPAIAPKQHATGCEEHAAAKALVQIAKFAAAGKRCQVARRTVERPCGVGLADRRIDPCEPGPIHANLSGHMAAFVDDRDVHGAAEFAGFFFGGADNASCFI